MKNRIIVGILLLLIIGGIVVIYDSNNKFLAVPNKSVIIKDDIINETLPDLHENELKEVIDNTVQNNESNKNEEEEKIEIINNDIKHDVEEIIPQKKEEVIINDTVINNDSVTDIKKEEIEPIIEDKTIIEKPLPNSEDKIIVNNEIPKTQEQINDELRKSIEDKYSVTIKYGEEMGDYVLRGYTPTKLTNSNEIYENLNNIKTHIAYYPVGFFKEMKDFGMPLTIYLVKNIPESDIAGITDKEFYDDIKITICTDQFFFRVFHHEVYHYIEAYMEVVGYNNGIFNNWDSLNPIEFTYGTTNSDYSYTMLNPVDNAYFINDYGQTNDREDRATIFEDLMARGYELNNSYIDSNNIWKKGEMISLEIDKYFNTVNASTIERWERFIYN